jgi:hypothetical protein
MSETTPEEQAWRTLGSVDPARLIDARLQLHWAIQPIAAVGYAWIERADDDSQSNLGWVDGMQIFAGRLFGENSPMFAALRPADLHVLVCDIAGRSLGELDLSGRTLEQAYRWLQETVEAQLGRLPGKELQPPAYDLPAHGVGSGQPFDPRDRGAFAELARWYHDANIVLRDLRAQHRRASMPRIWPHHFDLGMLISLEEHGDAQKGRSIGPGLSPGDEATPRPYWYVNPYPAPASPELPELPSAAHWHSEGWLGAVLGWDAQTADPDPTVQHERAAAYVEAAVAACRNMLAA